MWDFIPRTGDRVRLDRTPYEVLRVTWSTLKSEPRPGFEGMKPVFDSVPTVTIQLKETTL